MRSGTNARLFRTSFPAIKPKAEEELERHEARLATALELDRAARVLDVNIIPQQRESKQKKSNKSHTQWNGTEWVKEGLFPSEYHTAMQGKGTLANLVQSSRKRNRRTDHYPPLLSSRLSRPSVF